MVPSTRKKLIYAGVVAVLATLMFLESTFAWLGVSRIPFVSDVSLSVITDNSLLIAPDENGMPGEWDNVLDASALLAGMAPLKPVTYTADGFCKIKYDNTGRTNGVEPITDENINATAETAGSEKLAKELGYIVRLDFWLKCDGAESTVFLSDAVQTADGQMGPGTYVVGAPVWDSKKISHANGGNGSETTVRLGFEYAKTDLDGNVIGNTTFMMYEPNANIHYDTSVGYVETKNVNGNGPLIDDDHLIIQNASSWDEQDPILQGVVIYDAGKFEQNHDLFTIGTDNMVKVSLYIWMEGQDMDCIAAAVADEVNLEAHIQFGVDGGGTSTGIGRRDLS